MRAAKAAILLLLLAGCSSNQPYRTPPLPPLPPPGDIETIPEPVPKAEPRSAKGNPPFYTVLGKRYFVMDKAEGYFERGVASWYGPGFHAAATSNGERYDMYAMTAAHPTLPIPSYVRVTHLRNKRSVVVRVNDRGPFHPGRIIDLSYAAAFKLGYIQAGSAQVEIEAILAGQDQQAAAAVYLQVGAFSSRDNAESLRARVTQELALLQDAVQVMLAGELWRLHVGPYRSEEDARPIAERIEAQLNLKPLVIVR
jgi:rare lipoprotein A